MIRQWRQKIFISEMVGSNSLLVSSVDVKKPDQIVDNTMILSQYVDIYVSESAFICIREKDIGMM